jgi:hypothetical protein
MNRPSWVYVLAEDKRQQQLIYRFLVAAGVNPRQVQFELSPAGQGSAEQWVRENFARQAGKCRARNARAATGMFVITDADTRTVQERLNILDEALSAAGQTPIDASRDPIARLIPKRNVETWILVLGSKDTAVEEVTDYKSTKTSEEWSALISSAAETLVAWTRPSATLPASLIDSLRRGVGEIPRALPQGN